MEGVWRHWSCVVGRLSKESAMQGDAGKNVEGSIRVEVGGVENVRQNRVSPDSKSPNFGTKLDILISRYL